MDLKNTVIHLMKYCGCLIYITANYCSAGSISYYSPIQSNFWHEVNSSCFKAFAVYQLG
jgi:hypothetical protein